MASTNVYDAALPSGLGTLTLKLYPQGSTSIANGAGGDTASEDAAKRYNWVVTEALDGIYDAIIETAGGVKIGGGLVELNDDTGNYAIGASSPASDEAASVWSYTPRTLTQPGASVVSAVSGSELTVFAGVLWSISLTGLGNLTGRTKLWFSVKEFKTDTDDNALCRVEETAGLERINKTTGTAGNATITVDDLTDGDITIKVQAEETVKLLEAIGKAWYDVKWSDAAGEEHLLAGPAQCVLDLAITKANG